MKSDDLKKYMVDALPIFAIVYKNYLSNYISKLK